VQHSWALWTGLLDPYIFNWNFGIQHAFTKNNLSLGSAMWAIHALKISFGIRDIQ